MEELNLNRDKELWNCNLMCFKLAVVKVTYNIYCIA